MGDPVPEAKFLIYLPVARPADADNWLLDLLLQGYEYKADRASLALQEVGLPHEFLFLAEEHAACFRGQPRIQALKNLISKDDTAKSIRLKMVANNVAATELQCVIQKRHGSFWQKMHAHGYAALSQALKLRELLASARAKYGLSE